MAHTKSAGSTKYGRDSQPKYLGVKKFDGERVKCGQMLVRQRGGKFLAGEGVGRGKDDSLFALRAGVIKFMTKRKSRFDGTMRYAKVVNVRVDATSSAELPFSQTHGTTGVGQAGGI